MRHLVRRVIAPADGAPRSPDGRVNWAIGVVDPGLSVPDVPSHSREAIMSNGMKQLHKRLLWGGVAVLIAVILWILYFTLMPRG